MKKGEIKIMPEYYNRYIDLIPDIELSQALNDTIDELQSLNKEDMKKLEGKNYAPGKWTVNDILQHLIDTERIINYRALLFAREDNAKAPEFLEDEYAKTAGASKRNVKDLLEELIRVRAS